MNILEAYDLTGSFRDSCSTRRLACLPRRAGAERSCAGASRHLDPAGAYRVGSLDNGMRTKTVLTEIGPAQIEVPRDRASSSGPVIVGTRQRRLEGSARSCCR